MEYCITIYKKDGEKINLSNIYKEEAKKIVNKLKKNKEIFIIEKVNGIYLEEINNI